MKTILSFTTLDNYTKASHTYINKVLGIVQPETEPMRAGKEAHKRLQEHLMGKRLPIDLDWDCTAVEYHAKKEADDEFLFHGFLDGVNWKSKTALKSKQAAIRGARDNSIPISNPNTILG